MSEVVVPDGWEVKRLGVCCDVLDSQRVPLNSQERLSRKGVYPYYGANGVQGYIDDFIFEGESVLLAEDGGYFSEYATRPIANFVTGRYWVNNHAHILRAKSDILNRWIYYSLVHKNILKHINGGTRAKLNQSDLKEILVPLPPLPEQQKIASILTSVDEVIEKTQSQINKLQDLKKGTMNELLTKGIGHTEFKDSPVGKIPKGWDIVELGSLCGFTQGVQIPLSDTLRKETDGYIRYLYINDFSSDKKLRFVRNEYSEKIVTTKDLVMANTGHTAGSVFRGKHGVLSNNAFKISVNEKIIPEYLYYYLTTDDYWIQIGRLFNSAGQPHVGHGNIAKLNFLCPSIYEQSEVVNILFSIEQNIEEKQRKLEQTQSLKKSLMQDLLTGKVRVTVH